MTSNGGAAITKRGVLYALTSTNANPTLRRHGRHRSGRRRRHHWRLHRERHRPDAGTGYSFVAFATNSAGTTYTSPVSTFTTLVILVTPSLQEGPTAGNDSDLVGAGGA